MKAEGHGGIPFVVLFVCLLAFLKGAGYLRGVYCVDARIAPNGILDVYVTLSDPSGISPDDSS